MTKIYLKRGREDSVQRKHPWIFSGAVADMAGHPSEGDIVSVYDCEGNFLACGHYQIGSIAVRVLSFDDSALKPDFWKLMLERAYNLRKAVGLVSSGQTTCYRLVHGEGDNLPGLIIDYYDGVCVIQAHSAGMFRAKNAISKALQELYGERLEAVYDKSSSTAPFKAGFDLVDGYLYKKGTFDKACKTVKENGNEFEVDWKSGQKTGFFLDQRDNRAMVAKYACGKRVLNLFCYTGGFSVYALSGGALHVDSVDSSSKAIEMTDRNIFINGYSREKHESHCEDAIDFLKNVEHDKYDMMIVDPPAFAKHRGALQNALRAYKRLNAQAISKIAPGGLIFTYSCSQVVDRESFSLAVFSAATMAGRNVKILDRLNQPADHAVNIYHPEGEYLKGLLLYVE